MDEDRGGDETLHPRNPPRQGRVRARIRAEGARGDRAPRSETGDGHRGRQGESGRDRGSAPIVAVPTAYAESEMIPIYGITDELRKRIGRDVSVLPEVVIYNPGLTLSLPPSVTGLSAMNAMAHCVEAFWAPGSNPMTSLLAEEGIRARAVCPWQSRNRRIARVAARHSTTSPRR